LQIQNKGLNNEKTKQKTMSYFDPKMVMKSAKSFELYCIYEHFQLPQFVCGLPENVMCAI